MRAWHRPPAARHIRAKCWRGKPPWWPENEPWPPRGGPSHWRTGRGRLPFRRLFFLAALAFLALGVVGAVSLAWIAAAALGVAAPPHIGPSFSFPWRGLLGVSVLLVLMAAMMRGVTTPLEAVMDAADRVADGDYTVRVAEHGPPSIRALSRAFNVMTERLQNHDRQRRDLMADVAHELRTPLTVMQGKLEGLVDGVYPRDDSQLAQVLEHTHVLSRLVDDLRMLALSEPGSLKLQKEMTDVGALAGDVVRSFADDASARTVTLTVDAPSDLAPIAIDPVRIREVLTNLLSNALRHTPARGSIDVRVVPAAEGRGITIDVRDTGSGMTPDELDRAFDRFHKGPGSRGSGLGLTIARNLVLAHGGTIQASSPPGGGTTMTFTLPSGI